MGRKRVGGVSEEIRYLSELKGPGCLKLKFFVMDMPHGSILPIAAKSNARILYSRHTR